MTKRSSHSPGTSVVDLWARKKRRCLLTWNQGKRWLGRAQTKPGLARYRTKAFAEEQDAWQWAENTVAKYRLGLDNGNRCSISAVRDDYLEHLRGKPLLRADEAEVLELLDVGGGLVVADIELAPEEVRARAAVCLVN
jgi:hypothetical protein